MMALAKAHGEDGRGEILGQVMGALDGGVNATVHLVGGIIGVMGGADPELVLEDGIEQSTAA